VSNGVVSGSSYIGEFEPKSLCCDEFHDLAGDAQGLSREAVVFRREGLNERQNLRDPRDTTRVA
jgi:hypothetical protein